jgi:hypothetical protein
VAAVLELQVHGEHQDQEEHQAAADRVHHIQFQVLQHIMLVVAEAVKVVAHGMVAVVPAEVVAVTHNKDKILQEVVVVTIVEVPALQLLHTMAHKELPVVWYHLMEIGLFTHSITQIIL